MSDLFQHADMSHVLFGNASGKPEWVLASDSLRTHPVRDEYGNRFLVVTGTPYVIREIRDESLNISGPAYAVWNGGLMGELCSRHGSLYAAMIDVKRRMPAHFISRLYQEAGRPRRVAL